MWLAFLLVSLCWSQVVGQSASRVPNSPYPVSQLPKYIYVVDLTQETPDVQLLIQSLAGVAAQQGEFIYFIFGPNDQTWLHQIKASYPHIGILDNYTPMSLLRHFGPLVVGSILFDLANTTSAALTISGVTGCVVVTPATEWMARNNGIRLKHDVTQVTTQDVFSKFQGHFNQRLLFHQKQASGFYQFLADYAVFANAVALSDMLLDSDFGKTVLSTLSPASAVIGWGVSEHDIVQTTSTYASSYVHAADYCTNLHVLSNMDNGKARFHREETPLPEANPEDAVHYVTFVMTDGDNLQWFQNSFNSTSWYGSPLRGQFPVGWTFPPALVEVAPLISSWIFESATKNDDFVAAASGAGYSYPTHQPNLAPFASLTGELMKKANLGVLNILDDTTNKQTATQFFTQAAIDAIIYYPYSDYAGFQGNISYFGTKVLTGGRWMLAKGMGPHSLTPQLMIQYLNSASTNFKSQAAWDVVPVHVWSMTMQDIQTVVKGLAPHVKVVTPTDYFKLLKQYHPM